jgi:cytochrome c556
MQKIYLAALGAFSLTGAAAMAEDHHGHMEMMSKMAKDTRMEVDLPGPMKAMMLTNMRGHQQAVADILAELSKGDGAAAAKIAETRLGMGSPGSAACKPAAKSGELGDMPKMMAGHMPEEMRALGMTMHAQASKFAEEASKVKQGGDLRPALAELGQVVQACNACHAAYRLD